ncbi:MFS transporter [Pyxidicoccus fallax]|uniref:MFS transporter n=1 Tax=Pyxidicoccus fallax TaxID=394095 RepID=A0A848LTV6_9BACT|nr:MFS transporter [Pyxidicoccus fallax]NMO21417.1 MFS transporter [Pyxidicoccus fallax]NPC85462.1 MFS transporter [Pyxidicoccus fallax]
MPAPPQAAGHVSLAGFYFLYYATVGIVLPFLPAYLKSLSLSATQVGLLLSISPCLSLLAPPLWGHLADRTGRAARMLTGLALGATLAFSLLLVARSFPALVASMATYAVFATSFTPLIDSLAMHHVARTGGSYAHLRLFGSLGFIASSVVFGLLVSRVDERLVLAPLGLLALLVPWTLTLRDSAAPGPRPHPLAGLRLLRHPDFRWLLAATSLHWLACAPYHGSLSIHVMALGLSPAVVGLTAGAGVVAEVVVMALYPRLLGRFAPRHVLGFAFAASALRWGGMALTSSAGVLVTLAPLHGLTFGAFYVASVAFLARRVPPELRASGQALFAAVTFGLGGLLGYASSGAAYDWLGGHRLFAVAAALELVAAALVLQAAPPEGGPRPVEAS